MKDNLIKILSAHNEIIPFLETYNLLGLRDATIDQLTAYIERRNLCSSPD